MAKLIKLSDLLPDEECRIVAVDSKPEIRRRLLDMGLIPGTLVCCAFKSPWGDPSAYWVRGALVALRQEDAEKILITESFGGV